MPDVQDSVGSMTSIGRCRQCGRKYYVEPDVDLVCVGCGGTEFVILSAVAEGDVKEEAS